MFSTEEVPSSVRGRASAGEISMTHSTITSTELNYLVFRYLQESGHPLLPLPPRSPSSSFAGIGRCFSSLATLDPFLISFPVPIGATRVRGAFFCGFSLLGHVSAECGKRKKLVLWKPLIRCRFWPLGHGGS